MSILEVYNIAHKYDVIYISESYLDSTLPSDDNRLLLNDCNITCPENADNIKRGVCMYYNENVFLTIISTSYFDQCLLCEVTCLN